MWNKNEIPLDFLPEPSHINLSVVTEVKDQVTSAGNPATVALCKPVKVYVAPKPVKR